MYSSLIISCLLVYIHGSNIGYVIIYLQLVHMLRDNDRDNPDTEDIKSQCVYNEQQLQHCRTFVEQRAHLKLVISPPEEDVLCFDGSFQGMMDGWSIQIANPADTNDYICIPLHQLECMPSLRSCRVELGDVEYGLRSNK